MQLKIKNEARFTTKNIVFISIVFFVLSIIPLFLNHTQAISYAPYNYLILQALLFSKLFFVSKTDRNRFLLSPSFIAVSYININFFIGSVVFMHGQVFDSFLIPYRNWHNFDISMSYFNITNFFIINAYFISKRIRVRKIGLLCDFRKISAGILLVLGASMVIVFSIVDLDTSFLGGVGSLSIVPKSLGAILIFAVLFKNVSFKKRLLWYAIIILLFSIVAFNNKRDAILLLLPILLLESTQYLFTITLKNTALFSFVVFFLGYLILIMSISRGYGNYNPKGFVNAASYVDDYISSEIFIPSLMNNLEISYVYFHSNNAIEHIIDDPNKLSYGITLIKPMFIFFPRKYFPGKPNSIIDRYTKSYSVEIRNTGTSYPICFQAELFWNFHFLGVFFAPLIFVFLNSIYKNVFQLIKENNIINYLPFLYVYEQMLVMFRGSGLDLYSTFIIVSFSIFLLVKLMVRLSIILLKH